MIKKVLILSMISSCAFMDKENLLMLKNTISGYPQNTVTEDLYSKKNFSFIEISLGRGPSSIMSLRSIDDDIYKWVSEDDVSIYTYKGFVIKTEGLDHDVSTNNKSLNFNSPLNLNMNFLSPELYGIDIDLQNIDSRDEMLDKGWLKTKTTLYIVSREIAFLRWKKVDKFWVNSKTNLVDRSIQHLHPSLPPININFYYKFR